MLTTILVHAGVAAVGAAIAWALSGVIFADREPEDRPRWPIAAGIALAVVLGRPIAAWIDKPTVESVMRELETAQPVFALLRENEPEAYARLKGVLAPMVASGRPDADLASRQGREIISEVMVRRSMAASDQHIDEIIDLTIEQARALQQHPQICVGLITGRAGDVRQYVPAAMQEREAQLQRGLLEAAPLPQPEVMSDQELEAWLTSNLPVMAQAAELSPEGFAQAMQGLGNPTNACRAGLIFFEAVKRLEPGRRASFYRRLMREALAVPSAPAT